METVCRDGFSFSETWLEDSGSVRCIERMFHSAFSPLYYVSKIRINNAQTNVLESMKEKYLLCGVIVETIAVNCLKTTTNRRYTCRVS